VLDLLGLFLEQEWSAFLSSAVILTAGMELFPIRVHLNLVYAPGTRTECLTAQQKKERDAANERDVPSDMEIETGPQTGQTEKER
jgi:hypothetical protein